MQGPVQQPPQPYAVPPQGPAQQPPQPYTVPPQGPVQQPPQPTFSQGQPLAQATFMQASPAQQPPQPYTVPPQGPVQQPPQPTFSQGQPLAQATFMQASPGQQPPTTASFMNLSSKPSKDLNAIFHAQAEEREQQEQQQNQGNYSTPKIVVNKKTRTHNTVTPVMGMQGVNSDPDIIPPAAPPADFPEPPLNGGWPTFTRGLPNLLPDIPQENFYEQNEGLDFSGIVFSGRIQGDCFQDLSKPDNINLYEDGYAPKPIWDAIAPLNIFNINTIYGECQGSLKELKALGRLKHDLTEDEALAILLYCSDNNDNNHKNDNIYNRLNKALVQKDVSTIRLWRDYIYHLLKGLRKMKRVEGRVYRGVNKGMIDKYNENDIIYWRGFTSTSKNKEKAQKFMDGVKSTLYYIEICNGYDISELSPFDEDEVILEPGTAFVIDVKISDNTVGTSVLIECDKSVLLMPDPKRRHLKGRSKTHSKSKSRNKSSSSSSSSSHTRKSSTLRPGTDANTGDQVRDKMADMKELSECFSTFATSIKESAISDGFDMSINDVEDFYIIFKKLEDAIIKDAFEGSWMTQARDKWLSEVNSAGPHSFGHAASCLITLESYIKRKYMADDWESNKNMFLSPLQDLGGDKFV